MATVEYAWKSIGSPTRLNTDTELLVSQAGPAVTVLKGGNSFFAAWDQLGLNYIDGTLMGVDATRLTHEFQLNSTTEDDQHSPSLATLNNGNVVVAFTDHSDDPNSDIRARLFTSDGTAIKSDFEVYTSTFQDQSDPDVAALADGGFVVTWTEDFGGGDQDIRYRVYDSDGEARIESFPIDVSVSWNSNSSQVVGLSNGNFVVAWEQEPAAGGDTEVWFRIYDLNGVPIKASTKIDDVGLINEDVQIVALQDGGFAVAYTDNGWTGADTDITLRTFKADGTTNSAFVRANAQSGDTTGDQNNPTLTVLSNGYVVVGWSTGNIFRVQAFETDGTVIGKSGGIGLSTVEGEIAGLGSGLMVEVGSTPGTEIRAGISALVRTTTGNGASEALAGDSLRDVMLGVGGNDKLSGGAGDDTLEGGSGNDRLNGGSGLDRASYSAAAAAVKIDLASAGGVQHPGGGAGTDTFISIEGVVGSSFNDTLKGNAQANYIEGGNGDDILEGRGGNDTLNGGSGNDWASYASAKSGVNIHVTNVSTIVVNAGGAGIDTLINMENLIGSAFNDVLTGSVFTSGLKGGAGADRLNGETGDDTLDGGAGKDTIDGGAGNDWGAYGSATSAVQVNLGLASFQNTGGGGIDKLIGIEHLIGSKFNDRLTGSSGDNKLVGGAGADTLSGGGGADTLDGGAGNDLLQGGAGIDWATYASAGSAVRVDLGITGAQNTLGAGSDRLVTIEYVMGSKFADRLTGNSGANILLGENGNDTLTGGGGDDTLIGGAGADRLTGGAGNDTFRFLDLSESTVSLRDLITDFGAGDKIDLSAIDADPFSTLGDQAFHVDGTTGTAGDIGIVFDAATNRTLINLYVNTDATVDGTIALVGNHAGLTGANFVL